MKLEKILFFALAILLFTAFNGVCEDNSIVVNEDGNVGVGTSGPRGKFHVVTDGTPFTPDNASDDLIVGSSGHTGISIQTGPSMSGRLVFARNGAPEEGGIVYDHSINYMRFDVNSVERVRIFANGNVGIGKTSPSYKLDVNGTIRGDNVSPSDARWKTNVTTLENALDKVTDLRGIRYEWTDTSKGIGDQIGLIAQEVEEVFPEAVSTDNQGYKSVAYSKLVSPLIEAVKTLKAENDRLKQDNEEIRDQLAEIKSLLEKLQ